MNPMVLLNSEFQASEHPVARDLSHILVVLISRTVLFLAAFFWVAWFLTYAGSKSPYDDARPWWPVAGVCVNAIVLLLLVSSVKREGTTLSSLIGFDQKRFKKDVISSLWMIAVSIVLAVGANMGLSVLMYNFRPPSELMSLSRLPLWALIVGLGIFPLTNAFIEEMTYNGYIFPRLLTALCSPLLTVVVITLVFSIQHIAIPFAFNAKFLLWRVLSFIPLLLFWVVMYAKVRRLPSLIMTHWFMDLFAILSILVIPPS
jgi:membrane protease YdiL (CAAX protease family)